MLNLAAVGDSLFGISATDPVTFFGISLVLLAVAILASYLPALRAVGAAPYAAQLASNLLIVFALCFVLLLL